MAKRLVDLCIAHVLDRPVGDKEEDLIFRYPEELQFSILNAIKSKLAKQEETGEIPDSSRIESPNKEPDLKNSLDSIIRSYEDDDKQSGIKLDDSKEYNRLSNLAGRLTLTRGVSLNLCNPLTIRGLMTLDASKFSHFQIIYHLDTKPDEQDHIDSYNLPELTDEILINIVRNCTKLTSIILKSCDFITDRVLDIVPGTFPAKMLLIQGGPHLRHLNLSRCWNFSEKSLIKLLEVCPEITYLSLAGCSQITDKTITAISRCLVNLKELDVSECVKIQGIDKITKITSLKRLFIGGIPELSNKTIGLVSLMSQLEELDISGCTNVTDKGIATFGLSAKFENLKSLTLNNCKHLSPVALLQMLRELPTITELYLHEYNIKGMAGLKIPPIENIKKLDITKSTVFYSFDLKKFLNKFVGLTSLVLVNIEFVHGGIERPLSETLAHRLSSLNYIRTLIELSFPVVSDGKPFPNLTQCSTDDLQWFMMTDAVNTLYIPDFWEWKSRYANVSKFTRVYIHCDTNEIHRFRPVSLNELVAAMPNITEIYLHQPSLEDCDSTLKESISNIETLKLIQFSCPVGVNFPIATLQDKFPKALVKVEPLSWEDLERLGVYMSKSQYEYLELQYTYK